MSFGPELIWCWSKFLSGAIGSRVRKTEAADNWAALSFAGMDTLFLSWDAQACGVAIDSNNDRKNLLATSRQTPPVIGALKKHITGAGLTDVRQVRRDKILEFTFRRDISSDFSSVTYLILEATERYSNLILTDESRVIIEAAKHIHPAENRFRSTLPGFPYTPPPEFGGVAPEDWLSSPSAGTILEISGFGLPFLRSLSAIEIGQAAKIISQFYSDGGQGFWGQFAVQSIGKYITFSPPLPAGKKTAGGTEAIGGGIAAAGYKTTLSPLLNRDSSSRKKNIESYINKEIIRREKQSADIDRLLEQNPDLFREEAEIIISNVWQIKPGSNTCELSYWDGSGELRTSAVNLDPAISPQENASRLFAKYKKTAAAQKRAVKLREKVQAELEGLREQQAMVSLADNGDVLALIEKELDIAGKKSKRTPRGTKNRHKEDSLPPPHKRFNMDFGSVFAGLSAGGNRYVTFSLASPEDIWFHAYGVPGSHVILRADRAFAGEEMRLAVDFCASLAVWFSKARESVRARVDYTQKKHVSAIKGGVANVTYREFKSVTVSGDFWKEYLLERNEVPRAGDS